MRGDSPHGAATPSPPPPSPACSASSRLSRLSNAITHLPSGSIPRRPARPAIWVSSLWVRTRNPRSVRLVIPWSTTLRAGMWMPRLIVSVAKTTRHRPRSNRSSISRLTLGRVPAWWGPTPHPQRLEDRLVQGRLGHGGTFLNGLLDRGLDLLALRARQERLAFGLGALHRPPPPPPAGDEIDRGGAGG